MRFLFSALVSLCDGSLYNTRVYDGYDPFNGSFRSIKVTPDKLFINLLRGDISQTETAMKECFSEFAGNDGVCLGLQLVAERMAEALTLETVRIGLIDMGSTDGRPINHKFYHKLEDAILRRVSLSEYADDGNGIYISVPKPYTWILKYKTFEELTEAAEIFTARHDREKMIRLAEFLYRTAEDMFIVHSANPEKKSKFLHLARLVRGAYPKPDVTVEEFKNCCSVEGYRYEVTEILRRSNSAIWRAEANLEQFRFVMEKKVERITSSCRFPVAPLFCESFYKLLKGFSTVMNDLSPDTVKMFVEFSTIQMETLKQGAVRVDSLVDALLVVVGMKSILNFEILIKNVKQYKNFVAYESFPMYAEIMERYLRERMAHETNPEVLAAFKDEMARHLIYTKPLLDA